jgi:replication factor C subunit 1
VGVFVNYEILLIVLLSLHPETTTAIVVANESGRDCIEFNASDVRSKKSLTEGIGDVTGSRTLEFGKKNKGVTEATRKKRVIIMDEVDGMGGGDRGGMAELIQLIKHSRVPIICICNDRQAQKMKSLIPYCMDLRCRRPVKTVIARRAMEIARREGMVVEQNAAEAIAESCGNDVRQVINCMQMWANSHKSGKSTMTYKDVKEREKSINKDEILRVSLFDAAKMVLEGPKGLINADLKAQRDSFFKRNDAFFVDYSFVGLIVQQNYLKLLQHPYSEAKRGGNNDEVQKVLERMYSASESMSDYAVAELALRGGQNWSLLPFTGLLTVKTGFHAAGELGGFLPGYPEFTTYLGRNSTKGKKERLLSEIRHHTNFKVSGTMQELRSNYLPVLHEKIMTAIQKDDGVNEALDIMDGYGLDRDDVMEKFDEFVLDTKQAKFGKLDTKKKSEFTRLYNQRSHTSQALVAEQGASKTSKRAKKSRKSDMAVDPDAIDDDAMLDDEEDDADDDDEIDEAKVKAMFGKKKGKTTTVAAKTRTASKKATATKGKKTK